MNKNHIVWEKYENYVNNNLQISRLIMSGEIIKPGFDDEDDDLDDADTKFLENNFDGDKEDEEELVFMRFPVTQDLLNSIKLSTNFDCWVGHANFNITEDIEQILNNVDGVELLKVLTRYRFLIGIGKAFNFSFVRKNIRKDLNIDL